jgi:beta-mannosidase
MGASSPATLRQFLPADERYLLSPSWHHHDNPFAFKSKMPDGLGRSYHTVKAWTGRDPLQMDWEDYAFVSALLQAEGLQEFAGNYRRRMFSSAAAIFWMYNDSWPATHGWTIVDYYLRRKLAYHPVRRAFQPVTVVAAMEGDTVTVFGVNDSPREWRGRLQYGLFEVQGGRPLDETQDACLPPNASTALASIPRAHWNELGLRRAGAFALLRNERGEMTAQHRLFVERFRDLELAAEPRIHLDLDKGRLTLSCDVFAWGVCLDVDGEAPVPDNCFDLLPGIPYALDWPGELGEPRLMQVGNRFLNPEA